MATAYPVAVGTHGVQGVAVTAGANFKTYDPSSGSYVALADWTNLGAFDKLGLCKFLEATDVTAGVFATNPTEDQVGMVINTDTGAWLRTPAGVGIWAIILNDSGTYKLQFYTGSLDNAALTNIPTGITTVDLRFPMRYAVADAAGSSAGLGLSFQTDGWIAPVFDGGAVDAFSEIVLSANATLTTAEIAGPNVLVVLDTNNTSVTLPASGADGSQFTIKVLAGVTGCTLVPDGTETIDGTNASYPIGAFFSADVVARTGGYLLL